MLNNTAFALGLCIFLLIISAVFLIKHRYKRLVIILYLVALLAISTLFVNQKIDRLHNLCGNSIECTFTVIEDSERLGTSSSVSVKSNGGAIPRGSKIMLYCYTGEEYLAGDTLNAVVTLSGLADDKLRDYCYGNQIYVKGTARAVEKTSRISYFYYSLGVIRRFVKECLFNNLSYDAAALNIALTIGDKSYLSAEFNDAASKTGVSHIMVVSGLHVAIIMGFIMGSVQKLLRNSWIKAAIGVFSVVLISAICGFTLSVIRSAYMFI
ncbi:MAG: ComEC/Rec2 family competence protein, partial [Acutalibacteraceae bacterium]|nr:ComEC/Rec2 family competence protein [Acutalibacteraceae bacterium]